MAALSNRPRPQFSFISPMKPVTPGYLTFPISTHRVKLAQILSPSPHPAPAKMKFLSTHHKRVFPLNFSVPSSPLDSYRGANTQKALQSFPDPEPAQPKPTRLKMKAEKMRQISQPQITQTTSTKADLPPLAARPMLERRGKPRSKSIDYEDYIIGGNSYNSHLAEKMYNPRVIRISSRAKIRLFSLTQEIPRQGGNVEAGKKDTGKSEEGKGNAVVVEQTTRHKDAHDLFDGVSYPLPALSFADKMYRIKFLVDSTISIT